MTPYIKGFNPYGKDAPRGNTPEAVWWEFDGERWGYDKPRKPFPEDIEILAAEYGIDQYDGFAFVVFKQGETLYTVEGGHCSCYGLEGQWEPEETSPAALIRAVEEGELKDRKDSCYQGHSDEMRAAVLEIARAHQKTAQ